MKTMVAMLALLMCGEVSVAEGQITPADVPVILDLVVENIGDEIMRQDSRAAAAGIFLDSASFSVFQAQAPGLSAFPAEGRGYRTRSKSEGSRGAFLTVTRIDPGPNPGEYEIRVDPILRGRQGDTVIYTVAKQNDRWRVIDGIVLVQ